MTNDKFWKKWDEEFYTLASREQLIENLQALHEYVLHQANVYNALLASKDQEIEKLNEKCCQIAWDAMGCGCTECDKARHYALISGYIENAALRQEIAMLSSELASSKRLLKESYLDAEKEEIKTTNEEKEVL
jgi:hypothetical protein